MADLLIKGYDLKGSEILQLMECKDGSYLAWNVYDEEQKECEVVEIPTHGRLIDADELKARVMSQIQGSFQNGNKETLLFAQGLNMFLEHSPTVIEASEDGDIDG